MVIDNGKVDYRIRIALKPLLAYCMLANMPLEEYIMHQFSDSIGVERLSDNNTFRVTCPYCGQNNEYYTWDRRDDGLVHCTNCGSLIDTSHAGTPPTQPAPDTWSTSSSSTSSSGFAPAPSGPWAPPPKKSGGANTVVLVILILIGFFAPLYIGIPVLIGAFCYWLSKRQPSAPSRRAPQTW